MLIADVGGGFVAENVLDCATACTLNAACNSASYYGDDPVSTWPGGYTCWLKTISLPCRLPADHEVTVLPNTVFLLAQENCGAPRLNGLPPFLALIPPGSRDPDLPSRSPTWPAFGSTGSMLLLRRLHVRRGCGIVRRRVRTGFAGSVIPAEAVAPGIGPDSKPGSAPNATAPSRPGLDFRVPAPSPAPAPAGAVGNATTPGAARAPAPAPSPAGAAAAEPPEVRSHPLLNATAAPDAGGLFECRVSSSCHDYLSAIFNP